METRAHFVLIGAFCLLSALLTLVIVLWVNKSQLDRDFAEYDVRFEEAVTGLSVGSLVQFNGIQVGEVRKLRLDTSDPRRVYALVRMNAQVPVRVGTTAKLVYSGLTGVANIQLTAGDPSAPLLTAVGGEPRPLIPSTVSDLGTLLSGSQGLIGGADQALARLALLLSDDNIARVGRSLLELERFSAALGQSAPGLGETLARSPETLAAIEKAAQELSQAARLADQRLAALSPEQISRLIEQSQANLEALLATQATLQQTSAELSLLSVALREGTLPQSARALAEVDALARDLRRLAARLEARPREFWLGPGKFATEELR